MELRDILDENIIRIGIDAKDKDDALHKMAGLLYENQYIDDIEGFVKDVYCLLYTSSYHFPKKPYHRVLVAVEHDVVLKSNGKEELLVQGHGALIPACCEGAVSYTHLSQPGGLCSDHAGGSLHRGQLL